MSTLLGDLRNERQATTLHPDHVPNATLAHSSECAFEDAPLGFLCLGGDA